MTSQRSDGSQKIALFLNATPHDVIIPLNLAGSQYFRNTGYCRLQLKSIHWPYTSPATGTGHLVLTIENFAPNTIIHGDRSMQYTWLCPINIESTTGLYDFYSQTSSDDIVIDYSTLSRSPLLRMSIRFLYGESPLTSPPVTPSVTADNSLSIEFEIS